MTVKGTERWSLRLKKRLPRAATSCARAPCSQRAWPRALHARGQESAQVPRALDECRGRRLRRPDTRFGLLCGGRRFLLLSRPWSVLAGSRPSPSAGPLDDPAEQWLPRTDGATWTYAWSNTTYQPAPRIEKYTLSGARGHVLPPDAGTRSTRRPTDTASAGHDRLPAHGHGAREHELPVLAAAAELPDPVRVGDGLRHVAERGLVHGHLGHALAGLRRADAAGTRWNSLGGAANDVASTNRYVGHVKVKVPGVPRGCRRGAGRRRGHPGGRDRRPVRDADADRLLGPRRRAGADRACATRAVRRPPPTCRRRT